ncbi:putative ORFan [Tupanvirus deep ocean]|uniref:ORFan n=2 Tax=Tupanvirus TaxID=2094720 RepID=A0AC62A770_9VIRU|nr:putative ORFan [Tupanvirus deep ocean]QKU33614.1 putative ORFan [Tupanvirus deep ocean]
MEQILEILNSNKKIYQKYVTEHAKQIDKEKRKIIELTVLFNSQPVAKDSVMEQANGISDRFKNIVIERKSWLSIPKENFGMVSPENQMEKSDDSKLWWIKTMNNLYERCDVPDLYNYWLDIYGKIKDITYIRDQGEMYHKLTSHLNPGQLLQCDFYRAVQTFFDYGFEIMRIKENLGRFCARQSAISASDTLKFVIRKNNWIAKVSFTDDIDCISGILRPSIILDMLCEKKYDGEDFYAWASAEENTKYMIKMFEIGYDAMINEYFGHYLALTKYLYEKDIIVNSAPISKNTCRYFDKSKEIYHKISMPTINSKILYLHFKPIQNKLVLSFDKYVFPDNYTEGAHKSNNGRYYVIDYNNVKELPKVIEIVRCFLKETNPNYKRVYTVGNDEYTLDPLIDYLMEIRKKCRLAIHDNELDTDLYNGLIINYNINIIDNLGMQSESYLPCNIQINVRYHQKENPTLCSLDIKMLELYNNTKQPLVHVTKTGTLEELIVIVKSFLDNLRD